MATAMIRDEHGITTDRRENPILRGSLIGASFVIGGLVPVVPYALHLHHPGWIAVTLTMLVALALGVTKSRYTLASPARGAAEFISIVAIGTLAGVAISAALPHL